jgi:CorA-like Mg2+ transporter protein
MRYSLMKPAPSSAPTGPSLLPPAWQIPASIRSRLGREAGPQRAMLEDGHLLLILHEPPAPNVVEREPAFFWRTPGGEWNVRRGGGRHGSLADFLKAYGDILLSMEARESAAATAADYHAILESAAPVLRAVRGVYRTLQQAREMVKEDAALINHRDRAAALERTGELLLQDAQFGLNYIAARHSEAQAEIAGRMAATAHRLNVLAALFLPLTAVASVLGMSVHSGIPDNQQNFWLIVAAACALGLLVAFAIRKKG